MAFGALVLALSLVPGQASKAPLPLKKLGDLKISVRSVVRDPQGNGVYLSVYDKVPGGVVGLKSLGPDLRGGKEYAGWTTQPEGGKTGEDVGFDVRAGKAYFPCEAFLQTQMKVTDLASGRTSIKVFDDTKHYFIARPPLAMNGGSLLLVPGNNVLQPLDVNTMTWGENIDLGQTFGSMLPLSDDTVLVSTFDNADSPTFLIRRNVKTGETKFARTSSSLCSMKGDRGFIAAIGKVRAGVYQVFQVNPTTLTLKALTKPFPSTSTPAFAVRGGTKPLLALGDCGNVHFGLLFTTMRGGHGTRVIDMKSGRQYFANELASDMTISADGTTLYAKRLSLGVVSYRLP